VTNAVKHSAEGVESEADAVAAVNAAWEVLVDGLLVLLPPQAAARAVKVKAIERCEVDIVGSCERDGCARSEPCSRSRRLTPITTFAKPSQNAAGSGWTRARSTHKKGSATVIETGASAPRSVESVAIGAAAPPSRRSICFASVSCSEPKGNESMNDYADQDERPTLPALKGEPGFDAEAELFFSDTPTLPAIGIASDDVADWWAEQRQRALRGWVGAAVAVCVGMLVAAALLS
jgi:hypothetical protein